ncbi:MAG: AmmeMemoRadiSam system protein B [Candidatus Eisenbacteria bacterium]
MASEYPPETILPPLRALEIIPVAPRGQRLLLLRDPSGIAPEPLLISPASLELLRFFDGSHTLRDIQMAAARATGQIIPRAQIEGFAQKLEENHLLDSPGFQIHRERLAREYAAWSDRPARFAGQAYPHQPALLAEELSSYYRLPEGPGLPEAAVAGAPAGLAAPHIDPARGGRVYASAYAHLWGAQVAGVVALGISHAGARNPFVVTRKNYTSPLGRLRTAGERIDALAGRLDWDPTAEEDVHRWEHSIEFQILFLQHALGCGRPAIGAEGPALLPILCAFSWEDLTAPEEAGGRRAQIDRFLDALKAVLEESGHRWLLLAGVDLAHVGPRFGDREALSADLLLETHQRDRGLLEKLTRGDRAGFVAEVAADGDARRICGLAGLYSLATLLGQRPGRIAAYDQSVDGANGSLVSFCALVYPPAREGDAPGPPAR